MSPRIDEIDAKTASDDVLEELHEYYVLRDQETHPDDPPVPLELRMASWRNKPDHMTVRRWTLREGERIVGSAVLSMNQIDNVDMGFTIIHVLPEYRRRGHGMRLAVPVLDALDEAKRHSVITDVKEDSPWEPKLEAIGLKKALADRQSRLVVADVDWDLMDQWIEGAADRARDYELLQVFTPIPDEHLQKWCDLMLVMNTAPIEGLDIDDMTMSPEKWRAIEESDLSQGAHLEGFVAVHRPTGDWVGLSEIIFLEKHPEQAYQGDTGVDPRHRNKGLGRWLKAASIKSFMDRHPEVVRIDTENAGSNEPMLNINIEMGYKPLFVNHAWQGDVATVRERLGV